MMLLCILPHKKHAFSNVTYTKLGCCAHSKTGVDLNGQDMTFLRKLALSEFCPQFSLVEEFPAQL